MTWWLCKIVHAWVFTLQIASQTCHPLLRTASQKTAPRQSQPLRRKFQVWSMWILFCLVFFHPILLAPWTKLSDAWRFSCVWKVFFVIVRKEYARQGWGMGPTLVNSLGWALRGPKILNYWPDLELDAEGDSTTADAVADAQVSASSPKAESDQPDEIRCDH